MLLQGISRRRLLGLLGTAGLAVACAPAAAPTGTPAPATPVEAPKAADKPAGAAKPAEAARPTEAAKTADAAPKAAAPAAPASGRSIKYQQRQSAAEDFVRKKYAPEFEQKTGTRVVLEDIPDNEYFTKIVALSAARQLGDLAFGFNSSGHLASWAFKGITQPLDSFAMNDKYDLKQFFDSCIDGCRFEGKLHALPNVGHPGEVNLFWNRDMFEAAGAKLFDDSLTLDGIVEAATKTTKESGGKVSQWGYASEMGSWFQLIQRIRMFGGDLLAEDGKKTPINSEAAKAALQWEHDLRFKHKAAPAPDAVEGGVGNMFTAGGKVAINPNNVANVTLYKKPIGEKFKWGVQPWPKGPSGTRGATVHVNVTHMTSQSKEPQAAWEFLKLICSQEAGVEKILMGSGSPGARPDVWQDKRLTELDPWYQKGFQIMSEARAPFIAFNLKTPEIDSILVQRAGEIMLNKVSPAEGAEKMAKEIQAILDQPR